MTYNTAKASSPIVLPDGSIIMIEQIGQIKIVKSGVLLLSRTGEILDLIKCDQEHIPVVLEEFGNKLRAWSQGKPVGRMGWENILSKETAG